MKRVAGAASYFGYRAASRICLVVPRRILLPIATGLGRLAARLLKSKRKVVRRNLARIVAPEKLSNIVNQAFGSYARFWAESLAIPKPENLMDLTTHSGFGKLVRLSNSGGAVLATPHFGSYDLAGMWVSRSGSKFVTAVERVSPPMLFEFFKQMRNKGGMTIFVAGEPAGSVGLVRALQSGAVAALVADRDVTGGGIEVEFFGERTYVPQGPAALALRLGLPLACGAMYQRPKGRYELVVLDPIAHETSKEPERIREVTQLMARDFEQLIRAEPAQWHMFQPNWPSDPGYPRP